MARVATQIIVPQQLSNALTTLYSVPINRTAVVSRITFLNTTATDRFIDVHYVPNGGTASVTNQILDGVVVAAGETFSPSDLEAHVLPTGATIQALAEVASAITVIGSGTEIS